MTSPETLPPPDEAEIPRATYRLQLNRDFTLAQAEAAVPYLAELGISHCYLSPCLKARAGSSHGYDAVDYNAFNPEIGSEEDFRRFVATLRRHGMGLILDIVPNHMGINGADNLWWLDVLENGPSSAYADFFDIDWHPPNPDMCGKVLLPILGDHYGTVLNRGDLTLTFDAGRGEFSLYYYEHRLPVDPADYPRIIARAVEDPERAPDVGDEHLIELQSLATAFGHLPARDEVFPEKIAERRRDKEVHKRRLAALCAAKPAIATQLAEAVAAFNGVACVAVDNAANGNDHCFDALHALIKAQAYRLAYWRVAADEINYRRFFDQNDLAAVRMENPETFEASHRLVLSLACEGLVQGLRVDHADGLYDPAHYFHRLQSSAVGGPLQLVPLQGGSPAHVMAPPLPLQGGGREREEVAALLKRADAESFSDPQPSASLEGKGPRPLYLVIEKILSEHERLPDEWPIHGTTGYSFSNLANGLFVDGAAEQRMSRIYAEFIGSKQDFDEIVHDARELIVLSSLQGELSVLAGELARIAAASRHTCDFTLNGVRTALVEVVACFPVYRTYFADGALGVQDRQYIERAVSLAKRRSHAADISVFDFVRGALTGDLAVGKNEAYRQQVWAFAMSFQQYTPPVMAKGLEDTAFYRYHRLVSLNDVGGDPRRFGTTLAAFHTVNRVQAERWPHALLAGSTHDSKRAEDVRARIDVLSEIPSAWKLSLRRWRRINRSRKRLVDGVQAPSRNDEYLLYQTLFGTWPLTDLDDDALGEYRERIGRYLLKAVREAKERSSWINVNAEYEAALGGFVDALLAPAGNNPAGNLFLADFVPAVRRLARYGLINSLAQTLLRLTSPGVPDIYQGCELWQFNLVDPDNRRPVDFALRRRLLPEVAAAMHEAPDRAAALRGLTASLEDGRAKQFLIWRTLRLRRRWPEVFREGDYQPIAASGRDAACVCAYARRCGERAVIAVVPRLGLKRLNENGSEEWGDTRLDLPPPLAGRSWYNVFSGERLFSPGEEDTPALELDRLFEHFPVALLADDPAVLDPDGRLAE